MNKTELKITIIMYIVVIASKFEQAFAVCTLNSLSRSLVFFISVSITYYNFILDLTMQ